MVEVTVDVFKLWCWRRLLRVPWTAKISNESFLKEINPKYSLEGLMLKLKFQYLGHLMWRADSLEKTLILGKTEGKRRRGWQKMRWLDGIINSVDMNLGKFWGDRKGWGVLQSMWVQRVGQILATEQVTTVHSHFGAPKKKLCHCLHFFPNYLLWDDGTRCHDLRFLNVK